MANILKLKKRETNNKNTNRNLVERKKPTEKIGKKKERRKSTIKVDQKEGYCKFEYIS